MHSDCTTCRICFGEEYPLISPCKCTGTMKFVHEACLSKWVASKLSRKRRNILSYIFYGSLVANEIECDVCKHTYRLDKYKSLYSSLTLRVFILISAIVTMVLLIWSLIALGMIVYGMLHYLSASQIPYLLHLGFDRVRVLNAQERYHKLYIEPIDQLVASNLTIVGCKYDMCYDYNYLAQIRDIHDHIKTSPAILHFMDGKRGNLKKDWHSFYSGRYSGDMLLKSLYNWRLMIDYIHMSFFATSVLSALYIFSIAPFFDAVFIAVAKLSPAFSALFHMLNGFYAYSPDQLSVDNDSLLLHVLNPYNSDPVEYAMVISWFLISTIMLVFPAHLFFSRMFQKVVNKGIKYVDHTCEDTLQIWGLPRLL